ncbi:HlyD family type I secretion periplasmic adaptor subunit [Pontibacter sp. JAM-7]|uniref:HlyD family type I secretion periplasmic adaptor subunit n=1 Tax=Pontibacter sp. JAM-7 TaxID=3366581 RepID=UPI003AF8FF82
MKPNSDDLKFMSSVSEAMLEQTPRGAKWLIWICAAFIVIAIVWANLAQLDEITRGDGEIIPSSQLQQVETLEGGAVSEILVREGDVVQKGQILLRIDDVRFASSFKENQVRKYELIAKSVRLRSESFGGEFKTPSGYPDEFLDMLGQEESLYVSRAQEQRAAVAGLEQKITQRNQELKGARAQESQLTRSTQLLQQEMNITRPLVDEGVVSEVEYLRLRRQLNDLKGELNRVRLDIPRIQSTLSETREKRDEIELQFRNEARRELNEVNAEISRINEMLTGMSDRISRAEVRAPVTGTVKQLFVNTIDGVVQPGDELLNIIPWEDKLLVEARIKPSDIANIQPGQTARIKVSAYDFSIYGGVDAKVVFVSPSTILDEQDESYYLARLETKNSYIGNDKTSLPLIAGMTVSVDILTGKKSVMDYLLKPILKAKDKALTER